MIMVKLRIHIAQAEQIFACGDVPMLEDWGLSNQWFWGSLGSLAPYLIRIIIIPGSLAPPISMVSGFFDLGFGMV